VSDKEENKDGERVGKEEEGWMEVDTDAEVEALNLLPPPPPPGDALDNAPSTASHGLVNKPACDAA